MTIYVFTGPTLAPEDARTELDAVYLPPVAQGDVLRAGLRDPYAIGIVDGYFDRVPAVWHKEILWAMSRGIHVFGAGSMGALRAAELAPFGMVGVGSVFEAFRDGVLEDDDEVAVVHAPAEYGFRPGSEALVNIRGTLARAEDSGIVSPVTRSALEGAAKAFFYPERSYDRLFAEGERQGLPSRELQALRDWLPHGRIDQKRADALAMLEALRQHRAGNRRPTHVSFTLEHTKFWDKALQSAGVTDANDEGRLETVPTTAVLDELRLDPRTYARVRQEALLHALLLAEARRRGYSLGPGAAAEAVRQFRSERGLADEAAFEAWLAANHLTAERLASLAGEQALARMVLPRLRDEVSSSLLDRLRLGDKYRTLLARSLDKQRALEAAGLAASTPGDGLPSDEYLLEWFLERLGSPDEHTVEGQAAVLEYAHRHPRLFLDALGREYRFSTRARAPSRNE